ncbi:pseudouridine synthase [Phyllobacterium sp. 0TCS1.6C]|uniref:pseudouridine synthase n=1 Tax=unclassified Phyllobacterium TaxID=2638441 RepID=UPI0022646580|nr:MULTISPECIES: pseudouridine synthase [unclassified Phyllobacterium]MCX8281180.1 pseudouridine synthase [Phyllobacterium sp. 0TCS1.6C]MCX8294533.1 pseudouridine synthase [Phyllobacterium sp. 0TCS1.6A]
MTSSNDGRKGGKPYGEKRSFGKAEASRPRSDATRRRAPDEAQPEEGERIAKRLARAGIASRREAETMIAAGRVSVNGKRLDSPALNVMRTDRIEVDGKPLPQKERTRLWLYHKPAGLVTTNRDPEGRPTVFESLPAEMPRVLSVGRLDINTEGLLLLTNDGGLSRALELPSTGWLRRYRVRAHGSVTQEKLDTLKDGIAVEGVFYGAIEATLEREQGSNVWIMVGLREGKNREVKNVLGALGLSVNRLIRISYGPFQLGDLPEGAVREMKGRTLRDQLGDRLIEESGADFDAPVLNEFSNEVVRSEPAQPEGEARPRQRRQAEWISSSPVARGRGPRKPKGEPREPRPDDADRSAESAFERPRERPARSDSRSDSRTDSRGAAPRRDRDAGAKPAEATTRKSRSTNVWMAPGARPLNPTRVKEAEARKERFRDENRRSDREDRPYGDRPPRARKPEGDEPKRSFGGRPYGDRPHGDRPNGDRPRRDNDAAERGPSAGTKRDGPRPPRVGKRERAELKEREAQGNYGTQGERSRSERPYGASGKPSRGPASGKSERPFGGPKPAGRTGGGPRGGSSGGGSPRGGSSGGGSRPPRKPRP